MIGPSDGDGGAAGADAAAVDGLLCYGGRGSGGHAEELQEAEPPACHSDGGEVAGRLPAARRLSNSLRWRGGRGGRRRVKDGYLTLQHGPLAFPNTHTHTPLDPSRPNDKPKLSFLVFVPNTTINLGLLQNKGMQ